MEYLHNQRDGGGCWSLRPGGWNHIQRNRIKALRIHALSLTKNTHTHKKQKKSSKAHMQNSQLWKSWIIS